jgi:hypothetical protein
LLPILRNPWGIFNILSATIAFSGNTEAARAAEEEFSEQKWEASPIPAVALFQERSKICSIKPAARSKVRQLRQRGYPYD